MKKKILIGSIIAVVLLTLVSFSSVVGYNSVKSNPSNTIITDEYDSYTPIQLVFQLISKLRNNKEIQQLVVDDEVDIQDEIASIIESDKELNSIVEQLSFEDCGCDDTSEDFTSNTQSNKVVIGEYPLIIENIIGKNNSNNDFENYPNSVVNITRCLVLLTRCIIVLLQARIVGNLITSIYQFLSQFGDLSILKIIEIIELMIFLSWVARLMIIQDEAIKLKCNWLNYFPPQPRDI